MPLKKGSGRSAVSSNIKILVDEWEKDGSIGISHPSRGRHRGQVSILDIRTGSKFCGTGADFGGFLRAAG